MLARNNIAEHAWAREELHRAESAAKRWVEMSDAELRRWVTPPEIPRAFRVHGKGCPVHGEEVYRLGGYPWKVSLDEPWKVRCPVGGEAYPSNDFGTFLRSGRQDRSLLTGPYADDGWGWRREGETGKYWFVAYYNHFAVWQRGLLPGLEAMGRAYLLTEDPRYAHKAAVLLLKISEYYRHYDYGPQSRYGTEIDRSYKGKILSHIWETDTVRILAETYDAIYPALTTDSILQRESGFDAREIARRIETDLLREAAQEIMRTGKIRGNFGMHQRSLLTIALACRATVGSPTRAEMIDWVMEGDAPNRVSGVRDALFNLVSRDGIPEEAPFYNLIWTTNLVALAESLKRTGINLFDQPRFRLLYDWPIDMAVLGRLSPSLGDSGGVFPTLVGWDPQMYRTAFREYRAPRYAAVLLNRPSAPSTQELFRRPVEEEARREVARLKTPLGIESRLFPAYGFATLQHGGREGVAATLHFPQYLRHRHRDFLDLGLYAMGKALTPDFGYPETASQDDPRRFGFFAHTVAHNTVMIDSRNQALQSTYRLHAYDRTPVLQRVDVSASDVYPGKAQIYRRCVTLIPLTATTAYLVDFFRVLGGRQHDWLVHGSEANFHSSDLKLPLAAPGTVAGPDVRYGFFYDDPRLQEPSEVRSYAGYQGSGFQFLTQPQIVPRSPEVYRAEFRWTRDATPGHFALWCVGEKEMAILSSAKPQNRKGLPAEVKCLIRRRVAPAGSELASTFATVYEPFSGQPRIQRVERVPLTPVAEGAVALRIILPGRTDLVVFGAGRAGVATPGGTRVSGDFAYLSTGPAHKAQTAYVSSGSTLESGQLQLSTSISSLRLAKADWKNRIVTLDGPVPLGVVPGKVMMFGENRHAYEIRGVDRGARRIHLGDQECVVARGSVEGITPESSRGAASDTTMRGAVLTTRTVMPFARRGMHIIDERQDKSWRIRSLQPGKITISGAEEWPQAQRRFLVVDYGPGDPVSFSDPGVFRATTVADRPANTARIVSITDRAIRQRWNWRNSARARR